MIEMNRPNAGPYPSEQKVPVERDQLVEMMCVTMHDAYETAAISAGWETNLKSRKPWAEVPEANKETMRAAVSALLQVWVTPAIYRAERRGAERGWDEGHTAHELAPDAWVNPYRRGDAQ